MAVVAWGHVLREDSDTRRFITTESAIGRMAEHASAAVAATRNTLDGGGRDGATPRTTPHGESPADGLHAFEEAVVARGQARAGPASIRAIGVSGTVGLTSNQSG